MQFKEWCGYKALLNVAKASIFPVDEITNCLWSPVFSLAILSGAAISTKLKRSVGIHYKNLKLTSVSFLVGDVLSHVLGPWYEKQVPTDRAVSCVAVIRFPPYRTCISSGSTWRLLYAAATELCEHVRRAHLQFMKKWWCCPPIPRWMAL